MDITILNSVVCERSEGRRGYTLFNVGSLWREPPSQLTVWLELHNPSEREFTVAVAIRRAKVLIDETPTELVMAGKRYWQSLFEFYGTFQLEAKSHQLVVLLDGLETRTMNIDLGSPEGI